MHERFAAQNPEEAVSMLLGVIDQPIHIVEADHVLWLVDVDPASLTPEITAIGDRDIEERRECNALFESFLEALNGPDSLVAEVIGKLPERALVGRTNCPIP